MMLTQDRAWSHQTRSEQPALIVYHRVSLLAIEEDISCTVLFGTNPSMTCGNDTRTHPLLLECKGDSLGTVHGSRHRPLRCSVVRACRCSLRRRGAPQVWQQVRSSCDGLKRGAASPHSRAKHGSIVTRARSHIGFR